MKLSIIIPVYNEIHTISIILAKIAMVLPNVDKEIILWMMDLQMVLENG